MGGKIEGLGGGGEASPLHPPIDETLRCEETSPDLICYTVAFHNPNSLVFGIVQIRESFGLVNAYIFNGAYSIYYLKNHQINIMGFGFARVQIKGIRDSD